MTGDAREEVTRLLAENRRLRELLTEHGIAWQPRDITPTTDRSPRLGTDEKVKLFASLFRDREDMYPVRWESKAGKSGYSPACANEWRAGICEKPRIKCGDCQHRALIPVTARRSSTTSQDGTPWVCIHCSRMTPATSWRWTSMMPTGERMRAPSPARAMRWACRSRSRSPAPAMGHTRGSSSPAGCRHATPAGWAPPSSATPARAPAS